MIEVWRLPTTDDGIELLKRSKGPIYELAGSQAHGSRGRDSLECDPLNGFQVADRSAGPECFRGNLQSREMSAHPDQMSTRSQFPVAGDDQK